MLSNKDLTMLSVKDLSEIKGGSQMILRGAWYMQTPAQRRSFNHGFLDGFKKAWS